MMLESMTFDALTKAKFQMHRTQLKLAMENRCSVIGNIRIILNCVLVRVVYICLP